jgi:hypothetical protein
VHLDRLRGDVERLCNLAVGGTLGRHLGHAPLARGERFTPMKAIRRGRAPVAGSSVSIRATSGPRRRSSPARRHDAPGRARQRGSGDGEAPPEFGTRLRVLELRGHSGRDRDLRDVRVPLVAVPRHAQARAQRNPRRRAHAAGSQALAARSLARAVRGEHRPPEVLYSRRAGVWATARPLRMDDPREHPARTCRRPLSLGRNQACTRGPPALVGSSTAGAVARAVRTPAPGRSESPGCFV